jgi:hypothetical protein
MLASSTSTKAGGAMTADDHALTEWRLLVQAEYLEMPGLELTKPQAQRLWGLEEQTCDALLDELVESHFLRRTERNGYVLDDSRC